MFNFKKFIAVVCAHGCCDHYAARERGCGRGSFTAAQ